MAFPCAALLRKRLLTFLAVFLGLSPGNINPCLLAVGLEDVRVALLRVRGKDVVDGRFCRFCRYTPSSARLFYVLVRFAEGAETAYIVNADSESGLCRCC